MIFKGKRTEEEKNQGAGVATSGAGVFPLFIPNINIFVF